MRAVDKQSNPARREAALRYLFDRINYERFRNMPYGQRDLGLERIRALLGPLGNPQQSFPIIHVAGTKGKGSTTAMLGAILSRAGYRTGVYTSPHLDRLEERIAVDGEPCLVDDLIALVDQVRPVADTLDRLSAAEDGNMSPTYFDLTTAMALLHFAHRKVDVAILEVGLGGRLDSTNVCQPLISIITSISFDHTQQLGDTLASIAWEKAGIIKPAVPVISGVVDEEPRQVIRQVCRDRGCRLVERDTDFQFTYQPPLHLEQAPAPGLVDFSYQSLAGSLTLERVPLGLPGYHQAANAAVALAALMELRQIGWGVPDHAVRTALGEMVWPARVEVVARQPAVVLDAAHNVASVEALLHTLRQSFPVRRSFLVFATTQEKDLPGMLRLLLPHFDQVVFTQYRDNPRAVSPEDLQKEAYALCGRQYPIYSDPNDAWDAVAQQASADDLICVTGSFFIVADLRRHFAARRNGNQGDSGPPA